ncbi:MULTISPECIES: hypothetical protein [Myxococcus]|uniref:DUF883 domain-containing protein n=1 Tax=Myxococcus xanthus TaxID=34 RepID=A0AAE6FXG0_MYXXA|nr:MULTISPECIES: hypothetical protein [Myxococcus]QDE66932.1 hypothetical protein BHS09_07850 [Myxococcus xanthus]QDE74205.1 hypothetical protein BHS08_07855 [Myxococcus xanthus]QDE95797.1 hypothetical protein BHS05_07855 [Myxococcus xanthus]WAM28033.1 hypothetical protein OZ403_07880 [Myxococcus sp. NMCA1]
MGSVIDGSIQGSGYGQRSEEGSRIARGESGTSGIGQAGKEQAKQLGSAAKEHLYRQVESRRGDVAKGMRGLVSTLESISDRDEAKVARPLLGSAAGLLRRTSDRLENETTEELLADAQTQVRERPGLFIAGCVAAGFVLGRLIKS